MLTDSHCHLDRLDLTAHSGQLDNAITAAKNAGVSHMLCVCIDIEHFPVVLAIAKQYAHIDASVGLHPNELVPSADEPTVDQLTSLANNPLVVGIGETGLDYYRTKESDREWQQARFRTHIQAAKQIGKPLIIHTRQAKEDTLRIMREEGAATVGGVMHCFTEGIDMAEQAMDLGFYISFSGIVTFNNAKPLQAVARQIPLKNMLIETDAPYLAPVPLRGKPNEPAYVRYVAEFLCELKEVKLDTLAKATTANYFTLFGQ